MVITSKYLHDFFLKKKLICPCNVNEVECLNVCFSSNFVFFLFEGVQNKIVNIDENIYIPVTKAELAVLSSIFNV